MARAMGIIAFEGDNVKIEGISNHRPISSVSFLGRYRLIDFPLSNYTNSDISLIHVYVKEKPRSVFEHVGTGRQYNINSKHGKLRVMYGEEEYSSTLYNTDINAYLQNEMYIVENDFDHVIIAPSHFIYLQNFKEVLNKHEKSGVDVTVLYTETNEADQRFHGAQALLMDDTGRIREFITNRGQQADRKISVECYVMKKSLFLDLCHQANALSSIYWFKNILAEQVYNLVMVGYPIQGTVLGIFDIQSFYRANLSLIEEAHADLFNEKWPVYTRTNDSVPAYYGEASEVKDALVANGARVCGKVKNCVIGRNVEIEKGAEVSDSIILPYAKIAADVKITGCVIDKHAEIINQKEIRGLKDQPIYINRRDKL